MQIRILVGLVLLMLVSPVSAVQVDGLYSASVSVDTQSQAVRRAAIGAALNKVLQKVSGRKSIVNDAELQAALSNKSAYVEQFKYTKKGDDVAGYLLTVSFQKSALDKLLQQFDVPVWGSNRPDVLIWLAVEQGKKRYLVNSESSPIAALLKQVAADTGLAITLPLLDIQDQRAVGFFDVWGGFSDNILQASKRYRAKHVMYGSLLKRTGGGWQLKWTLTQSPSRHADLERADTLGVVVQATFHQAAEVLANIYAPRGDSQKNRVIVEVEGVTTLEEFSEVTRYLSSLDRVKKVNWTQMSGSKLLLELHVVGNGAVLKNIIALNNVLSPMAPPAVKKQALVNTQEVYYYQVN